MSAPPGWTWTDALVLASIVLAPSADEHDPGGLIGTADYIDHAVLTRAEIESAVNRLLRARLLDPAAPLRPTRAGQQLWEQASGRAVIASVRRLADLLAREAALDSAPEVRAWQLTDADYARAVDRYQRGERRTMGID